MSTQAHAWHAHPLLTAAMRHFSHIARAARSKASYRSVWQPCGGHGLRLRGAFPASLRLQPTPNPAPRPGSHTARLRAHDHRLQSSCALLIPVAMAAGNCKPHPSLRQPRGGLGLRRHVGAGGHAGEVGGHGGAEAAAVLARRLDGGRLARVLAHAHRLHPALQRLVPRVLRDTPACAPQTRSGREAKHARRPHTGRLAEVLAIHRHLHVKSLTRRPAVPSCEPTHARRQPQSLH